MKTARVAIRRNWFITPSTCRVDGSRQDDIIVPHSYPPFHYQVVWFWSLNHACIKFYEVMCEIISSCDGITDVNLRFIE